MALLDVEQLRKSFGPLVAVDGVSLSVDAGEVFGLLGPNGAGKSTTMSMIAGLIEPDSGAVRLNAMLNGSAPADRRLLLGVVPQDLAVYPDLKVRENLTFFGSLYGIGKTELTRRVDRALDRVGLTDRQGSLTHTLSGGMKRRLNFAVALLHEPRLLILDEPTVGVDPQSRAHLLDCVRDLSAAGMAVIYASHYMEEVQAICRRVAIMDHGKVLANDTLDALLNRVSARVEIVLTRPDPSLARQFHGEARYVDDQAAPRLLLEGDSGKSREPVAARLARVLGRLAESGIPVRSVETQSANLERLFLDLTGRGLRD
jgi:ABC-2 type transport system ATP-binding protein